MDHTITYDNKREMEQEAMRRIFVQIPLEIFYDSRLTPNDKIIYGRISTFDEFFESKAHTAELLNVSVKQVQRSVTKLLELGYIKFVHNDGRGNRYKATEQPLRELRKKRAERVSNISHNTRVDEIDSSWTICPHDRTFCPPNRTICPTEYKERLNGEKSFNSSFDKSKEDEQARNSSADVDPLNEEQPKRYGNEDVNAMLDLWESETGFSHHKTKAERYAMSGLIRQYGCEALKALIRRVGRARRSDNRFAPQIAKPSQLRGKYSKLEALTIWEERMDKESANESTGPDLQKLYATPSEYLRDDPEPTATKEELHEAAEAIRESYRGTKYEHIFCRRKIGGQK